MKAKVLACSVLFIYHNISTNPFINFDLVIFIIQMLTLLIMNHMQCLSMQLLIQVPPRIHSSSAFNVEFGILIAMNSGDATPIKSLGKFFIFCSLYVS
jgi:hypothetical protein